MSITPAGHASSIASKAHTKEPMSELEKTFTDWKSSPSQDYESAKNQLKNVPFNIDDLHHLMLKYKNEPRRKFPGVFLSAGYNILPENVIVHDLELTLEYVGYKLHPEKLLINRGRTGSIMGTGSNGVVVNCGHTKSGFGLGSKGINVNAGYVGGGFGQPDTSGLAVSITNPERFIFRNLKGNKTAKPFSHTFRAYLSELTELCQGPTEHIYTWYGDNPSTTIQHDISKLLREEQP